MAELTLTMVKIMEIRKGSLMAPVEERKGVE